MQNDHVTDYKHFKRLCFLCKLGVYCVLSCSKVAFVLISQYQTILCHSQMITLIVCSLNTTIWVTAEADMTNTFFLTTAEAEGEVRYL